jgi:hypothetical protein
MAQAEFSSEIPPGLLDADVQIQLSAELQGQTMFTRHYFSAGCFR